MLINTNKLFCYWLQGYFEIGQNVTLNRDVLLLINKQLDLIEEPLGDFTLWLQNVCTHIKKFDYQPKVCRHFLAIIQNSLSALFHHVIDNSYDTEKSLDELQAIHDGKTVV